MLNVKVKTLTATMWDGKRVEKGKTLEVPAEVAELNPTVFALIAEASAETPAAEAERVVPPES